MQDFMIVVRGLEKHGLLEWFGDTPSLTEDSLIARSQQHPSVPFGDAMRLIHLTNRCTQPLAQRDD